MGGRGASSSVSDKGNAYGSQYRTVLQSGNIKFVTKLDRQSETLMETMTKGRVYVEVGGNDLLRVTFFDDDNRRNHVIERDKRTGKWHTHNGYFHSEYGKDQHEPLGENDKKVLANVSRVWYNHLKGIV